MENSELNKIVDLRQSPGWISFLEFLGWKCFKTSDGVNVAVMKSFLGNVAKVQRPKNLTREDLAEIDDICLRERVMLVKVEPSLGQDLSLMDEFGFSKSSQPLSPPSTIIIDPHLSEEQIWEGLSHSAKYSVRRARREGAKVVAYQSPPEKIVEEFFHIPDETAKFKGFIAPLLSELKKKAADFGDDCHILLVVDGNGKTVGGNFYLGYKKCVWFMHGGITPAGRSGRWGYELFWQSFLYFRDRGYKFLDLEGRDDKRFPGFTKNWSGFTHFKEKFGGQTVQFPYPYIKLYSPALKLLKRIYSVIPL